MKKPKASTVRALVALGVFVVVAIGLVFHTGVGTLSSLGYEAIAAICPLGALESLLGTWTFVPRALIALGAIVLIVVVVGKAFCAWMCPVPHLQDFFKTKKRRKLEADERQQAAEYAHANYENDTDVAQPRIPVDTRHAVLGGALLSTAIFGFPVFCLVCPIGLTFATFIGLWRLVQFNEPTWGLLAFPAILLIEVLLLRRWCMKICPLGALFSLISAANKTLRPAVNRDRCLRDVDGVSCDVCAMTCPEHIDPHSDKGKRPLAECIKCRGCADACPVHAITFPFKPRKQPEPKTTQRNRNLKKRL